MYKNREEQMVSCPYNKYHVVSKLRIQQHIMRCKKNNPEVKLVPCFYNYSHWLKPEDLLSHYEICSHKTRVDGARYCEPNVHPLPAPKNYVPKSSCPDINVKTQFFQDPPVSFPPLSERNYGDSQKLETSESESESDDLMSKAGGKIKSSFFTKYEDDELVVSESDLEQFDEEDDNLEMEPLPLPKTVSKAFVCTEEPTSISHVPKPSQVKRFGRGKSLVAFPPPKEPRPTDHLLPDLSDMDESLPKRETKPKFFLKNSLTNCNASLASLIFDDSTTLNSEEVVFGDELQDEDNDFILKNFDKYIKIN